MDKTKFDQHVMKTYNRCDLEFVKAKGARLTDSNGRNYIDMLAGLGVNNLGHDHPAVLKGIKEGMKAPLHVSNLYRISTQGELAALIQKNSFKGRTFFCNSGAEANEAAYKFAVKYGKSISRKKTRMLSALNSFHGRTVSALSLTGQKKYQESFKPLLSNISNFRLNDLAAFKKKIGKDTAAVFLEMVQGEGGVYIADRSFIKEVRKLCDKYKALLIIDEVQTGCSRTGRPFAFMHYGVQVDAFTAAKSLAGGLPIGALTVREKYKNVLVPGDHASTFGGSPFVTAVGVRAFGALSAAPMLKSINKKAKLFAVELAGWDKKALKIKEIRQLGLMIAVDFDKKALDTAVLAAACLDKGLIVNSIAGHIIRMIPPLVITDSEIKKGLSILKKSAEGLIK